MYAIAHLQACVCAYTACGQKFGRLREQSHTFSSALFYNGENNYDITCFELDLNINWYCSNWFPEERELQATNSYSVI